jgi:hypothetical protein
MGDAAPKDIHIHQLCTRLILEHAAYKAQDFPKCTCFVTIQVSDMLNMPLGFQIREGQNFCIQAHGQSPERVFPYLDALEFRVASRTSTKNTF